MPWAGSRHLLIHTRMFTDGITTYSCDTLVAGLILQSTPIDWWCLYWIHGDMDPSIYTMVSLRVGMMQLHKLCKHALELEQSGGRRGGVEVERLGGGQRWVEKGKGGCTMTVKLIHNFTLPTPCHSQSLQEPWLCS